MPKIHSLNDVFLEALRDMYDAEKQLVKGLPGMVKAASTPELKEALRMHLDETKNQVTRVESVFDMIGAPRRGKKCKAMEGLLEEGSETAKEDAEPHLLDALLIGAGQKVEHYEIATYGTLVALAEVLGLEDAVELLNQSLAEEKAADEKLTEIAETVIYPMEGGEGEEEEEEEDEPVAVAAAGRSKKK